MSWWNKSYDEVLGINERNLNWVYPKNPRKFFALADDKVRTKQILSEAKIPVAKQLMVIDRVGEIEQMWSTMPPVDCAIKPSHGRGGGGILILNNKGAIWEKSEKPLTGAEIYRHLANIIFGVYSFGSDDSALIEEKIVPHKAITTIFNEGVADLRVIVCDNQPVMAMLRIPTIKSRGKANLHQGALGIGIDMMTGRTTRAFNGEGYVSSHPDSGHALSGFHVPYWKECLEIAIQSSKAVPLNYLGVDIAFDDVRGPLVLEINVRPGLEIQNVNEQGLKSILPRS